ncbi:MAG: nuclear transport factor 2 family protein [Gammaproteobacteria bacterium]
MSAADLIDITHLYALYAQALDEKRFALLARVFTADAVLHYEVAGHQFDTRGAEAGGVIKGFLDRCYWTNHVIAHPAIALDGDRAHASARVIATHLQRLPEGTMTRWEVRGSYHDRLQRTAEGWRITRRHCVCVDVEGEFLEEGVELFPEVPWAAPDALS